MKASWLLAALGLVIGVAALCAYGSLCLLFYQGQWQLLYHPDRTPGPTPASLNLPFETIPFAPGETGTARLTGWWIPLSTSGSTPACTAVPAAATTVLFLHDSHGSLSDTLPALAGLHNLGCNVFAIEYRGFGPSAPAESPDEHPSEAHGIEDVRSALAYLTGVRHISSTSIIIYGVGVGATWGAMAADRGDPLGGLILERVNVPARETLRQDPRTRLLPVSMLLTDRLDASAAIARSRTPKLFLVSPQHEPATGDASTLSLYRLAAAPKAIGLVNDPAALAAFLRPSAENRK